RTRRSENQGGGAGRLFENFQASVGDIAAHGFGTVENENAAAAHWLEVSGTLNGANLADAEHWAGYRSLQTHGIGDQSPDVGMRLQDQWSALDGGGVGAFAAFGDTLLDEFFGVGKERDAQAGGAFAAEVVGEALTVGGLREHAGERVFANSARAGEEQC